MIPPRRRRTRWRVDSCRFSQSRQQTCLSSQINLPPPRLSCLVWNIPDFSSFFPDDPAQSASYPHPHPHPRLRGGQNISQAQRNPPYLLDVVVAQGAAILELLTSEDETLLVWGDALLVLDLGLDVVDGVARLDVEGNGLTREGLDEAKKTSQSCLPMRMSMEREMERARRWKGRHR